MTSFFLPRVVRFGWNFADWYRMTCRLRWCVEMETICKIPIWRTFGRIQWHVIPEPRITLQGAATRWIHCHDSRATCHIAGCSHLTKSLSWSCHVAGSKNSILHIENRFSPYFIILFLILMQFWLWRRRLSYRLRYTCLTLNNIITLKFRFRFTQGHWKWHHSKALVRFPIRLPYGSILYHFWDKARYWSKILIFS